MKKNIFPAMILALVLCVSGCSKNGAVEFVPTESCLSVTREGTVTSVIVEQYEGGDYTEDELRASAEEYLGEFNDSQGDSVASLSECSLADGTATLQITFRDAAGYLNFMEEYPDEESEIQLKKLDVVSVPDGVTKGYLLSVSFTTADSAAKSVSAGEIMNQTKLFVVSAEGPALIHTDGAIKYISSGVTLLSTNDAQITGDGKACIVFE